MANIIASPTRYIQGKGELQNLRQHVEMLGKKLFIPVSYTHLTLPTTERV